MKKIALILIILAIIAIPLIFIFSSNNQTPEATPTPTIVATETPATEPPATEPPATETPAPEDEINTIISLAPSITETLVALGVEDKIVGVDIYSSEVPGISPDVELFDMMAPDIEKIIAMNPDLVITSEINTSSSNPFDKVTEAGIEVIYLPTAISIEEIKEQTLYLGELVNQEENAQKLVDDIDATINEVTEQSQNITEPKTVYFEISPAPYMYTTGSGTYLNEMIEIIGAENIFADLEGWVSITSEAVIAADPDIILTNNNMIEDPVGEIVSRPGWESITAVENGDVYYIDTNSSSRANYTITIALKQMAEAVYPDVYDLE